MRTLRVLAYACLTALASGGLSVAGTLKEFRTSNYDLWMQSEPAAAVLVEKLAGLEQLLDKLIAHDPQVSRIPTTIYVVPRNLWQSCLGASYASDLVRQRFSNLILIHGWQKGSGLRNSAYHQYTTVYLRSKFPTRYPYWYESGLVYLMFTASIGRDGAEVGHNPFENYSLTGHTWPTALAARPRLPIDKVLGLEWWSPGYSTLPDTVFIDYQSWALVHRSLMEPEFGIRTAAYLDQIDRLQPVEQAIRAGFGVSPAELDQEMDKYEARTKVKRRRVTYDPAPPTALTPVRTISDGEALAMLASAMISNDEKKEDITKCTGVAATKGADPADIKSLGLRAAVLHKDDDALEHALTALEPSLSKPDIARAVVLTLVERLYEDDLKTVRDSPRLPAIRNRAFSLAEQQMKVLPQDPAVAWAYAMLAVQLNRNLDLAAAQIVAARAQMPRHPDLAVAAALLAAARNQPEAAAANLVEVLRFSRRQGQREWAARTIDAYHGRQE